MTFLATLLRGLRARTLLSVGSLLLTAVAIGSAMLGPIFQDAVTSSYIVTRLADEPNLNTGLSVEFHPGSELATNPQGAVEAAVKAVHRLNGHSFATPQPQLETPRMDALGGRVLVEWKPDVCARLVVTGRCPRTAGEVLLHAIDAAYLRLGRGDTVRLGHGIPDLRVVGTYRPKDGGEDYWFDRSRLVPQQRLAGMMGHGLSQPFAPAPMFVAADLFEQLPRERWLVRLDSRLSVRPGHAAGDLTAAQQRISSANATADVAGGTLNGASSNQVNDLASVVKEVSAQQANARRTITPATVSLVLIALTLLLRLLSAAAELRVPELAVASLRGATQRQLWGLGLAEPVALILLAVPPGAVFGYALAAVLAREWLVPGLPVHLPPATLAAAAVVVVAAVGVAVLAVDKVVRAPLAEQLSGVRRPSAVPRVLRVFFLACLAGSVALIAGSLTGTTSRAPDIGDFLLPILLAVVAGLAATWLVARLAQRYADTRRATRSIPGFVSARALARRSEGTLVILPITAALAIAAFSMGVNQAATSWRASAAATVAPADVVWTAPELALSDAAGLTHRLDPKGRWLMAAASVAYPQGLVTVMDTDRLARVAQWPTDWVGGRDAAEVQALLAPRAGLPRVTGSLSVAANNQLRSNEPVFLHVELEGPDGPLTADLGPFPSGSATRSARLPVCLDGCLLRTVTIGGRAALNLRLSGIFTLTDTNLTSSVSALGLQPAAPGDDSITGLAPSDGGVVVGLETPPAGGKAALTVGGLAPARPVLVGSDAQWHTSAGPNGSRRLELPDGPLDVHPVATARSVPLLGPTGVLLDYSALVATHDTFDQISDVVVLARADTPTSVTDGLRAQGLAVKTTLAAQRSALDGSAYALALRLYVVAAALVLLMALGGLLLSTVVQLPARRRDAASLRVVGVRGRQVVAAVARELLVVLGAAAAAGLAAGLVAEAVVVRTLTLGYAAEASVPEPMATLAPGRLVVLSVVTALVLAAIAFVSAAASVRGARGASLRESAR